jgi:hypothetical protein
MTTTLDVDVNVTSPWRGPLVVGAAVAAIPVASTVIIEVINAVTNIGYVSGADVGEYLRGLASQVGFSVVRDILFGAGVVLAVRIFASILMQAGTVQAGWRHTVSRILLVAGAGAAIVFVGLAVVAVIAAFSPGQYPFGYDFQPTFDGYSVGNGVLSALVSGLFAFLSGAPVVGLVLLWQRLFRRDVAVNVAPGEVLTAAGDEG